MNCTIRDYAAASDWEAICRVHDRARPVELEGSCDARAFIPLAQDPESAEIDACQMWVACEPEGGVLGFAGVQEQYVAWLYVDPDWYRRGVGRQLLKRALAAAGPQAWTIALSGNQRALGLYRSEGFEVARTFAGNNGGYPCTCLRLELVPANS